MNAIMGTLWAALVLYIMYSTDAVYSYLSSPLLRWLSPLTKVKDYRRFLEKNSSVPVSYADYMKAHYNGFFMNMLTCRVCFGLWVAIIVGAATDTLTMTPAIYFGSIAVQTFMDAVVRGWDE